MIGRAVTAFRKSVIKSKSSNTLADANEENESIISDDSQSISVRSHRRDSDASSASTRLLWLKKQRRSQSANREGDNKSIASILENTINIFLNKNLFV